MSSSVAKARQILAKRAEILKAQELIKATRMRLAAKRAELVAIRKARA